MAAMNPVGPETVLFLQDNPERKGKSSCPQAQGQLGTQLQAESGEGSAGMYPPWLRGQWLPRDTMVGMQAPWVWGLGLRQTDP